MVRASETYLIEFRATGDAEKAIERLAKKSEEASKTIERSNDRSSTAAKGFEKSTKDGERALERMGRTSTATGKTIERASDRAHDAQDRFTKGSKASERGLEGVAGAGVKATASLSATAKASQAAATALGATGAAAGVAGASIAAAKGTAVAREAADKFNATLVRLARNAAVAGVAMSALGVGVSVALGRQFVQASADAESAGGKFDVVFGELADRQRVRAEGIAKDYQRSFVQIQESLSTFQDTFVPFGFARAEAAELSEVLTKLSIDIASFSNAPDSQALMDLQSAVVGNVETLRKYGVVIDQNRIDQKLLAQGIEGGVRAATQQEKALAIVQLALEGTRDAQGDAIRTSGEWNNQMKALTATIANQQVVLGDELRQTIIDTVEELGGMDRVLELVTLGMAFAAGATEVFVRAVGEGSKLLLEFTDSAGGAEEVARRMGKAFDVAGDSIETVAAGVNLMVRTAAVQLAFVERKATQFRISMEYLAVVVEGAFLRAVALGSRALIGIGETFRDVGRVVQEGLTDPIAVAIEAFQFLATSSAPVLRALGRDEMAGALEAANFGIDLLQRRLSAKDGPSATILDAPIARLKELEQVVGLVLPTIGPRLDALDKEAAEAAQKYRAALARNFAGAVRAVAGDLNPELQGLADFLTKAVSGGGLDLRLGVQSLFGTGGQERDEAERIGREIGEGVVDGVTDPLERLDGVFASLRARMLQEQQALSAQTDTFTENYAALWERVTLTTDEQVQAVQRWAASERSRIQTLLEENRVLDTQAASLLDLVDRVEEEGVAKARGTQQTNAFSEAVERAGDQAVNSFAGNIAEAVVQLDLAQLSVANLAQTIIQDLVRAVIQAAIVQGLTGGLGSIGGGTGFLGLFAGGGVVPGGSTPVGGSAEARATMAGATAAASAGIPFHAYAGGGVVDSPQLFVAGEGPTSEAIVPMPNGAVPVEFRGGGPGGTMVVQMNVTVQALDGADAERVFQRNAGALARTVAQRLQSDRTFRGAVGRAGR